MIEREEEEAVQFLDAASKPLILSTLEVIRT
jgi:hypothetical protein